MSSGSSATIYETLLNIQPQDLRSLRKPYTGCEAPRKFGKLRSKTYDLGSQLLTTSGWMHKKDFMMLAAAFVVWPKEKRVLRLSSKSYISVPRYTQRLCKTTTTGMMISKCRTLAGDPRTRLHPPAQRLTALHHLSHRARHPARRT